MEIWLIFSTNPGLHSAMLTLFVDLADEHIGAGYLGAGHSVVQMETTAESLHGMGLKL